MTRIVTLTTMTRTTLTVSTMAVTGRPRCPSFAAGLQRDLDHNGTALDQVANRIPGFLAPSKPPWRCLFLPSWGWDSHLVP